MKITKPDNPLPERHVHEKHKYNQVFDRKGKRMRGLWEKNGHYYGQFNIQGKVIQLPLHDAATVPDAETARQAIKKQIAQGTLDIAVARKAKPPVGEVSPTSPGAPENESEEGATAAKAPTPAIGPKTPLSVAIAAYQRSRDLLDKKDKKTCKREDSGLRLWSEKFGTVPLDQVSSATLMTFAEWRKERVGTARTEGKRFRNCSGRAIDLDVMALNHVLEYATKMKWLVKVPELHWDKMASAPAQDELLTVEQLDEMVNAALIDPAAVEMLNPRVRHLRLGNWISGQYFSDYLRLMSLSGGREQETLQLHWSNVTWSVTEDGETLRGKLHFPGAAQGGKRGGGSVEAGKPRDVKLHSKLEAHLKAMHERSDTGSDLLFPSKRTDRPICRFSKQLTTVKRKLHANYVAKTGSEPEKPMWFDKVTFQWMRHYFISHCVMKGIDLKTIAEWVNHRDGGVLIGRLYGHLYTEHKTAMSEKLDTAF